MADAFFSSDKIDKLDESYIRGSHSHENGGGLFINRNRFTNDLPPGTRVWIYIRYSPGDNQTIDSQLHAVETFCKEHGWIIDDWFYDEWKSGSTAEDREGFMLMVSQSRLKSKTVSAIVMWDTKRFSRGEPWEAQFYRALFRKNGFKLVFIVDYIPDDPIVGPLMEVILDIMARQQLFSIRAGTIRGLITIVELGFLPNGHPATGFICKDDNFGRKKDGSPRIGKKPEIDPSIAPLVIQAFELKARGAPIEVIEKETGLFTRSTRKNKKRDSDSNGEIEERKKQLHTSWNYFFQNRAYIGEFVFHGKIYKNVYPAIISQELFDAVQALIPPREISKRDISSHPRRKNSQYLVANKSFCGYCGARMVGKPVPWRGKRYRYYLCSRHDKNPDLCPNSGFLNADDVENQLFEILTTQVLTKDYLLNLLQWTNKELNTEHEGLLLRIEQIKSLLAMEIQLNRKMTSNFLLLKEPTEEAEKLLHEKEAYIKNLRTELTKLEEIYKDSYVEATERGIVEFVENSLELLSSGNIFDLKAVFGCLVGEILMFRKECRISLHFPNIQ